MSKEAFLFFQTIELAAMGLLTFVAIVAAILFCTAVRNKDYLK